jgi:hypothetical protein
MFKNFLQLSYFQRNKNMIRFPVNYDNKEINNYILPENDYFEIENPVFEEDDIFCCMREYPSLRSLFFV